MPPGCVRRESGSASPYAPRTLCSFRRTLPRRDTHSPGAGLPVRMVRQVRVHRRASVTAFSWGVLTMEEIGRLSGQLHHILLDFRQMQDFIAEPFIVERADGIRYWDVNGKEYLDGLSGVFVVNVGHNNRAVIEAMKAQLDRVAFAPPLHGVTPPAVE